MTGLHTGHTYVRGNREVEPEGQVPLPAEAYTLTEMLQSAGYVTGVFGKWGLGYPGSEGAPERQGVNVFYGYNCQRLAHNYYPDHLWDNGKKVMLEGNRSTDKKDYSAALIHQLHEATTRGVIPLVSREVVAKASDPFGQQRNLHFGRPGVLGPAAELREDSALLFSS